MQMTRKVTKPTVTYFPQQRDQMRCLILYSLSDTSDSAVWSCW